MIISAFDIVILILQKIETFADASIEQLSWLKVPDTAEESPKQNPSQRKYNVALKEYIRVKVS